MKRFELLAKVNLIDLIKIGLVLRQLPTSQSKSHLLMSSEDGCHSNACCAVETLDLKPQETIQLALDPGSVATVIKRNEAPQFPLDGRILRAKVGDVSRNLIASCDMFDAGHRVVLDNDGCFAVHKKTHKRIPIKRVGKSFLMQFALKTPKVSSGNGDGKR